ncbi:serine/threonine-protein kinase [Kutzneria viridogrisea]|uniref:non-specific serine/threonine protein kinase n=2 Tax=Kutzneria TaxID=43356 RepID=W5W224_9PSEU|nr:serine/threonine-protein kinase [Kutzneria albida]AHH95203.1 putative serine/threonine protein kinase [Kutzneria albida DSM 43870]MBA8927440.1 serine/threonine protein kinase [Kutzneria viridogrisea]
MRQEQDLLAGRYRLGALLGEGGVARVYRAVDVRLNRLVAVKLFRPTLDEVGRRRFAQEARVLGTLRHPGLVKLFDAGTDGDRAYLVMELVDGATLLDRLCDQPLGPAEVAELGATLAQALTYVHARGVVHRDVKPSNILLDSDGAPHLADFGFARAVDATAVSPTGQIVGTAAYLAPEQVRGEPVGPAADVYALGLVLLECLTGELEYEGPRVEAALARLTRPPRIPADLPAPLAAALVAMTRAEPEDRPSARSCATRLSDVAQRLTTRTGVLSVPQLRRRRTIAVAAIGALALAALLLAQPHGSEEQHSVEPQQNTTTATPQAYTPIPVVSPLEQAADTRTR